MRVAPDADILYLNLGRTYTRLRKIEKTRQVMQQLLNHQTRRIRWPAVASGPDGPVGGMLGQGADFMVSPAASQALAPRRASFGNPGERRQRSLNLNEAAHSNM